MISNNTQKNIRNYNIKDACIFKKNKDEFGNLSNMAAFMLNVNDITIRTSEALYQACKFPDHPDIQKKIIEQKSPMTAKMVSRTYQNKIRRDWENIKIKVMYWCIRVKLAQHFIKFGITLESTGHKNIVEDSKNDNFWGAIKQNNNYVGINALGRLLMELRKEYFSVNKYDLLYVPIPEITDLILCSEQVSDIDERYNFVNFIINEILHLDKRQLINFENKKLIPKERMLVSEDDTNYIYHKNKNFDNKIINVLKTGNYTSNQIIEKANLNISPRKLSRYLKTKKKYINVINEKPLKFELSFNFDDEQTTLPF